jgi:DDE superfamily endonuclease
MRSAGVHAGGDQVRGMGVPQVVWPDARKPEPHKSAAPIALIASSGSRIVRRPRAVFGRPKAGLAPPRESDPRTWRRPAWRSKSVSGAPRSSPNRHPAPTAVTKSAYIGSVVVHYTPTYASWLNQVEIWFNIITQRAIRRGTFRSVGDLVTRIDDFVHRYNRGCHPFLWTATADSILDKLERLCKAIAGTSH